MSRVYSNKKHTKPGGCCTEYHLFELMTEILGLEKSITRLKCNGSAQVLSSWKAPADPILAIDQWFYHYVYKQPKIWEPEGYRAGKYNGKSISQPSK